MASSELCCSFCTKKSTEVTKLIAGDNVYICNECVDLCDDILNPERHVEKKIRRSFPTVQEAYEHYEEARKEYQMMLRLHRGVDVKEI